MDNKVHWVRDLLIPLGIGAFSIFGICIVLLIGSRVQTTPATPATFTATAFKYLYLASPTYTPDPELETAPPEETSPVESTGPIALNTLAGEMSATPSPEPAQFKTQASVPSQALTAAPTSGLDMVDVFDDQDARLEYDGDWVTETGIGEAFQGTLSVSDTSGDDIIFFFIGQQMIIGYLGESDAGTLLVLIDDTDYEVDQSTGERWTSPLFDNTEHSVIIIHSEDGPINIDYINILGTE